MSIKCQAACMAVANGFYGPGCLRASNVYQSRSSVNIQKPCWITMAFNKSKYLKCIRLITVAFVHVTLKYCKLWGALQSSRHKAACLLTQRLNSEAKLKMVDGELHIFIKMCIYVNIYFYFMLLIYLYTEMYMISTVSSLFCNCCCKFPRLESIK